MSDPTYVLGEIASAHDGDWMKAQALAEVVLDFAHLKAQWWSDPEALADRRHVGPEYREVYRRYQIPLDWIAAFSHWAHRAGRDFICSAFLPQDFAVIAPFCDRIKIASFECGAEDVLAAAERANKPLIISTGMADRALTERLWQDAPVVFGSGVLPVILHCVSAYPAPMDSLNLSVLRNEDGFRLDGFSDHSANVLTGALAVAAGARVLEVHVRLHDTSESNPDYACALDPDQFRAYVANVRLAEAAMGDGIKRAMPVEQPWVQYRVRG